MSKEAIRHRRDIRVRISPIDKSEIALVRERVKPDGRWQTQAVNFHSIESGDLRRAALRDAGWSEHDLGIASEEAQDHLGISGVAHEYALHPPIGPDGDAEWAALPVTPTWLREPAEPGQELGTEPAEVEVEAQIGRYVSDLRLVEAEESVVFAFCDPDGSPRVISATGAGRYAAGQLQIQARRVEQRSVAQDWLAEAQKPLLQILWAGTASRAEARGLRDKHIARLRADGADILNGSPGRPRKVAVAA
jgi:hypothetical protein